MLQIPTHWACESTGTEPLPDEPLSGNNCKVNQWVTDIKSHAWGVY